MYIENKTLSVIYKLIVLGLAAYGVAGACVQYGAGESLRYFTLLSNILVGAVTLYLLVERLVAWGGNGGRRRASAYLRGMAMLSISVTCIVFNVMLAPQIDEPLGFENYVLHVIVPVGFVLDWLLFAPKGMFRFPHIALWIVPAVAYEVIVLVAAIWTGFYPYPFLDVAEIGGGWVAIWTVVLLIGFSILGAIYVAADKLMGRRARRAPARQEGDQIRCAEQGG
jgi:hypothetical protein